MQDTMALAASYQEALTALAHAEQALEEANAAQRNAYEVHSAAVRRVGYTRAQFESAVNHNAKEASA